MTLPDEKFLVSEQLVYTSTEDPSIGYTQKDPLLAQGLKDWQYVGIISLSISLIVLVRVLSPKVEHAILFALALSVVLIISL